MSEHSECLAPNEYRRGNRNLPILTLCPFSVSDSISKFLSSISLSLLSTKTRIRSPPPGVSCLKNIAHISFSIFMRDMMISSDLNFSRNLRLHPLVSAPSQSTRFYFDFMNELVFLPNAYNYSLRYLQSAEPSSLSCSAYNHRQHATFGYTRWFINSSQHLAQPYPDIVSAFCQEIRLLLYNIVRPQPANDCWNATHQKKINLHCFRKSQETATVTSNHLLYLLPPSARLNGIFPFQFSGRLQIGEATAQPCQKPSPNVHLFLIKLIRESLQRLKQSNQRSRHEWITSSYENETFDLRCHGCRSIVLASA
jgi:hypothetical protein